MNISLESGVCSQCTQENSVHIDKCHKCGTTLPWAGSESTKVFEKMDAPREDEKPSLWKLAIVYGVATFVVVMGGFLWVGNVSGFFPTFSGAGFFTIIAGGAIFKWGDKIVMGIE